MGLESESLADSSEFCFYHFLILHLSLEIVSIIRSKNDYFEVSSDELKVMSDTAYKFGIRYFEYKKTRITIKDKVLLGEVERTLEGCVSLLKESKKAAAFLCFLIESEICNLVYWNNPSGSSSKSKKLKHSEDLLIKSFEFEDKLPIMLIKRFEWVKTTESGFFEKLKKSVYCMKKKYLSFPSALEYCVEYICQNNLGDLKKISNLEQYLLWSEPGLNVALRFLSLPYSGMEVLHKIATSVLEKASDSALTFYIPEIIQTLRTPNNSQIKKFILKVCKRSAVLSHQFMWALEVEEIMTAEPAELYLNQVELFDSNIDKKTLERDVAEEYKQLRHSVYHQMKPWERKVWENEKDYFDKINEISAKFLHLDENTELSLKMSKLEKSEFVRSELKKIELAGDIYMPTAPNIKVKDVIAESAVALQSAKKVPFLVTFKGDKFNADTGFRLLGQNYTNFIKKNKNRNEIQYRQHSLSTSKMAYDNRDNTKLFNKSTLNSYYASFVNLDLKANNFSNFAPKTVRNLEKEDSLLEDEDIFPTEEEQLKVVIPKLNAKFLDNQNVPEDDLEQDEDLANLSNCTEEDIEEVEQTKKTIPFVQRRKMRRSTNINELLSLENGDFQEINCIFKVGDDLRQDSLALQIISVFKEIFDQANLGLFVFPYKTISTITGKHKDLGGFIECVPNCDSRDQIGKTYDTDLFEYFKFTFGHENSNDFRKARKNLIESQAAYSVISYILQIKDRHNGNIMIDDEGHIIHIDFGFIFDISPGGNIGFEKAAFKMTKEMIKIIGDEGTESYEYFVELSIKAFLACRDYMDKLLDPVILMFNSGIECFRENSIQNFRDRFKLELDEVEATLYFKKLIKEANDNWRTNFYDYIQKKQNNIHY